MRLIQSGLTTVTLAMTFLNTHEKLDRAAEHHNNNVMNWRNMGLPEIP